MNVPSLLTLMDRIKDNHANQLQMVNSTLLNVWITFCMLVTGTLSCPATYDSDFGILWPSTGADMNATNACPGGIGLYIPLHV